MTSSALYYGEIFSFSFYPFFRSMNSWLRTGGPDAYISFSFFFFEKIISRFCFDYWNVGIFYAPLRGCISLGSLFGSTGSTFGYYTLYDGFGWYWVARLLLAPSFKLVYRFFFRSLILSLGLSVSITGWLLTGTGSTLIFLGGSTCTTGVDETYLGAGGLIFSGRGLGGGLTVSTLLLLSHMLFNWLKLDIWSWRVGSSDDEKI